MSPSELNVRAKPIVWRHVALHTDFRYSKLMGARSAKLIGTACAWAVASVNYDLKQYYSNLLPEHLQTLHLVRSHALHPQRRHCRQLQNGASSSCTTTSSNDTTTNSSATTSGNGAATSLMTTLSSMTTVSSSTTASSSGGSMHAQQLDEQPSDFR
ncbi:hypothetical protein TKK_0018632 [Trichogramma kaykai]